MSVRPDRRREALEHGEPVEPAGDLRGAERDEAVGRDEVGQDAVEDRLDLVAERVVGRADAVRLERDVGEQPDDEVVRRRPAPHQRLDGVHVGPAAGAQVVGVVVHHAPVGGQDVGLAARAPAPGGPASTSTHSCASPVAPSLIPSGLSRTTSRPSSTDRPARCDLGREREQRRRLADAVRPDERDLRGTRPGGSGASDAGHPRGYAGGHRAGARAVPVIRSSRGARRERRRRSQPAAMSRR